MGAIGISFMVFGIFISLTFFGLWVWSLIHFIQSTKSTESTELDTAVFASLCLHWPAILSRAKEGVS